MSQEISGSQCEGMAAQPSDDDTASSSHEMFGVNETTCNMDGRKCLLEASESGPLPVLECAVEGCRQSQLLEILFQDKMLADKYKDAVIDPRNKRLLATLDLRPLITQFIDNKFEMYFDKCVEEKSKNDLKQQFLMDHMLASLTLLLPNEILKLKSKHDIVKKSREFLEEIVKSEHNSGIVDSVINDEPNFIHRVFTEYFAARWFSENYAYNRNFLKENLFTPNFKVIRRMFDSFLSNGLKLHTAVINNDKQLVERLLSEGGTEVNSIDEGGRTALHLAAALKVEPDEVLSPKSMEGMASCSPQDKHMVALLLDHGCDINITADTILQCSPLEYSVKVRSWEAMEILLAREAASHDLVIEDTLTKDEHELRRIIRSGFVHVLTLFLDHGLPVDYHMSTPEFNSETLLQLACHYNYGHIPRLLIDRGAGLWTTNWEEKTCLHISCENGNSVVATALMESFKGDRTALAEFINIPDLRDNCALMLASSEGHLECVKLLVSHRADVTTRNKFDRHCLHEASNSGRLPVVQWLIESFHCDDTTLTDYINTPDDEGNCALVLASIEGHLDCVKLLVSHGADVTIVNRNRRNCLQEASKCGHLSVVQWLIESFQGNNITLADYINNRDREGNCAVMLACMEGHLDCVKLLVAYGADVTTVNKDGRNCLHEASMSGRLSVVQCVLESFKGDDSALAEYINTPDEKGNCAMMLASINRHFDCVKLLVSNGANVTYVNKNGRNCLHEALESRRLPVIQWLIESFQGDNLALAEYINTPDKYGNSTLMLASKDRHLDSIKLLVSHGADVTKLYKQGQTFLHEVSKSGQLPVVRWLIEGFQGDDMALAEYINTPDREGNCAVLLASKSGQFGCVKLLVSHGADVTTHNKCGRNCLHEASNSCRLPLVRWLIESFQGDSIALVEYINTPDFGGNCAMMLAAMNGHLDCVKLLVSHGADVTKRNNLGRNCLHEASRSGLLPLVQWLTDVFKGDDKALVDYINTPDRGGSCAVLLASIYRHFDCVKFLVSHGANVTLCDSDSRNCLREASLCGRLPVIQCLIESFKGDNTALVEYVNAVDLSGNSALMLASIYKHLDCVKFLVSLGADVTIRHRYGRTCLHEASKNGDLFVAQIIIESFKGDNIALSEYINAPDLWDTTAVMFASMAGSVDCVQLLVSHGADVTARCEKGRNCLLAASLYGRLSVVQWLIDNFKGDDTTLAEYINTPDKDGNCAVKLTSRWGYVHCVKLLVSHGADIRTRNKDGRNCLFEASKFGFRLVLECLIESFKGNNIALAAVINTPDKEGNFAVVLASTERCFGCVQLLVSHGADVTARNKDGNNCIYDASKFGELHLVQCIIENFKGNDSARAEYLNIPDKEGNSAVLLAASSGHFDCLKLLVSHGADITTRNNAGRNCLHEASQFGDLPIVQWLITRLGANKAAISDYIKTRDSLGRTAQELALRPVTIEDMGVVGPVFNAAYKDSTGILCRSDDKKQAWLGSFSENRRIVAEWLDQTLIEN